MESTISEHIDDATDCLRRLKTMLAKHDKCRSVPGVPLLAIVDEALAHLQKASTAASAHHIHYSIAPDVFNPFNLFDIERSVSRFAVGEQARTVHAKKLIVDPDPAQKKSPAEERLKHYIIVYSIVDGPKTSSFFFNSELALSSYQDDEHAAKKQCIGPLIANHGVRCRLLGATSPPGKVDLDAVARVVEEALGKALMKPDITSKSWFSYPKEYVLDIVSVFALVAERRRKLEIPGVGDRIDLEEEDTLSRYLGTDSF